MPSHYERPVDPDLPNNAHSFMLQLVGWNQNVLELGAASGYITRALVAQSCVVTAVEYDPVAGQDLHGVAEEVLIADLNDPTALAGLSPGYDVVLAGDVLEHLLDPQQVLNSAVRLLAPGGRVVISLPHVGHVDLRLSLLQGRWRYSDSGLLDETHIRFFTLTSVLETVARAGLVITEMKRVRIPAFQSELGVDPHQIPPAVLDFALADPEALTYQFVFSAVRDDGDHRIAQLGLRALELEAEVDRLKTSAAASAAAAAAATVTADPAPAADSSEARLLDEARTRAEAAEGEVRALYATKTFRLARIPRRLYQRLR